MDGLEISGLIIRLYIELSDYVEYLNYVELLYNDLEMRLFYPPPQPIFLLNEFGGLQSYV